MSDRLELGDVVQINGGVIWFVEHVGGENLVLGRCVRPRPSLVHPFGGTASLGRPHLPGTRVLARDIVDFEHACAIVALLS